MDCTTTREKPQVRWRRRRSKPMASAEATEALHAARNEEVERVFEVLREASDTQERVRVQRERNHLAEMFEEAFKAPKDE